jgi:hypothetical protein
MNVLYDTPDTRNIMLKSQMQEGVAFCYDNLDRLLTAMQ